MAKTEKTEWGGKLKTAQAKLNAMGKEEAERTRYEKVEDFKDIACAVARGVMANPARKDIGCGDRNADHRAARQIRAAARIIYEEIAEEMERIAKESV